MTTQEIHGYASYGIRLTRRQALRALIRRSRQLDLPGSQVSPRIPVTTGSVRIECLGGGGSASSRPLTDQLAWSDDYIKHRYGSGGLGGEGSNYTIVGGGGGAGATGGPAYGSAGSPVTVGGGGGGASSFGPVRAHSYEQELDITASDLSEAFTALQLADDRHTTDVSAAQRLWNYLWAGRFGGSDVAASAAAVPDGIIKADTKLTEQEAEEIRQRFAAATASTLSRMTGDAGESDQPAADFARQLADDVTEVLRPGTRCESCGRFLPRDRQHICPKAVQS